MHYESFLSTKRHLQDDAGFAALWMPDFLFDFQRALVEWSLLKGRAAIFADCGLGKTPMQLVWAENVTRKTNKPVLILTPLAVSRQTVREGEKFGIYVHRSEHGEIKPGVNVTNYERLHHFSPHDFAGVVCDESSILKNFDGALKASITDFMRKLPYRLLCTATAAPNDYIEFGTHSEALGGLGYMDMLGMFFKNDQNSLHPSQRYSGKPFYGCKWRFKSHAERPFWQWLCSWARAIRKPSDLGFDDGRFLLPDLRGQHHLVNASRPLDGYLFPVAANGLSEQRQERKYTVQERCERAASLINGTGQPAVAWCHLNAEGDLLEKLIPDSEQVSGSDTDERKEDVLEQFAAGKIRVLVTKSKIAGFGLNWQHCGHLTFFPSHSFEQYYQSIRRCWRFGRTEPVTVDLIGTAGEADVMKNLQRKAEATDKMFAMIVQEMANELKVLHGHTFPQHEEIPAWL